MKRKIRIDIYTGFDDAPRAYDKKQIIFTDGYDIDRVISDITNDLENMVQDLEDIRNDPTDY